MLPASNFVCEFGECVRPASPLVGVLIALPTLRIHCPVAHTLCRGRQTRAPSPAFDDSDVLTESDFNLFDADHTSQDAL